MASNMTIMGTVVAQPSTDGISVTKIVIGQQRRMADGTLRGDYTGKRRRVAVAWEGLTQAEKDALETAHDLALAAGQHTVVLPNGASFSGHIEFGSYDEKQWYDRTATPVYDVTIAWLEA